MKIGELIMALVFCGVIFLFLITILFGQQTGTNNGNDEQFAEFPHQKWICQNNKCAKSYDSHGTTLISCQMICGDSPPLWPKPKQIDILKKDSSTFLKEHIFLKIHSPDEAKEKIEYAANLFLDDLSVIEPNGSDSFKLHEGEEQIVKLNLHVKDANLALSSTTNESYTLFSQKLPDSLLINIFADNYFGIRHGLETLSQLIWFDTLSGKLRLFHDIKISDQPSFGHRGVLIDVSRHFFPINLLKKAINGMAASKLNVLHLHVADAESFPILLPHNEQLALNGAYDYESKYSPSDIKELIEYAKLRGIRTIMEIDAPSHVSPEAWPKNEILCNDHLNMFNPTLNPDNPKTLDKLESIYKDLFDLGTDSETFHIGDDEVLTDCWKRTDSARKANFDIYKVWAQFTNEMMERVIKANNGSAPKNIVLWSSPLTDKFINYLSFKNAIVVQYWFGQFRHLLDKGYKIIFSTVGQWYLDCGFGPWRKTDLNGACDPYTDWRKFYKYRPWNDYSNRLEQVLGGEVCLWSEQVGPDDLETRLWPRSAAFAERVWSDPEIFEQDDVFRRIDFHSGRLRRRGFRVAAIWPQICSMFPDRC